MTAQVHRALISLGAGLAALTGLLSATDPSGLGLDATTWAWITFGVAIGILVVNAARSFFEPAA